MLDKIYLNLLILCGILLQGIVGTSLENNYKASSNLHSRKKRVIDDTIAGGKTYKIADVPYIVKVLKNGEKICAGIIVSPVHILTITSCADDMEAQYLVESGEPSMNNNKIHEIYDKLFYENLVLLVISTLISFQLPSLNQNILLYEEAVGTRTYTTISGWATKSGDRIQTPSSRRSTNVQVSSWKACSTFYKKHYLGLSKNNICTLELSGKKGCSQEDGGSALVLDGKLVGVLFFAGRTISPSSPDVFIRVNNHNIYYKWIMSHVAPYLHKPVDIRLQYLQNIQPHPRYLHNNVRPSQYLHPRTQHYEDPHSYNTHVQYPHAQHPHVQYQHIQFSHPPTSQNQYSHPSTQQNPDPPNHYLNLHTPH